MVFIHRKQRRTLPIWLLAGTVLATSAYLGSERADAFFRGGGGFGIRGFHGGGSRFGDGGFFDRSRDAGFGRGGFGNVHSASSFSDHADTYRQSHPEYQRPPSQSEQARPDDRPSTSQTSQVQTGRPHDNGQCTANPAR